MLHYFPNDRIAVQYNNTSANVILKSPGMIYSKEFQENRAKVVEMLHGVVVNVTYELHDTLKKTDGVDEKIE